MNAQTKINDVGKHEHEQGQHQEPTWGLQFAMETLEMLLCGGAAGTAASGRSLVGLQMLLDTLEIALQWHSREHARKPVAPIGGDKHKWHSW